MTLITHETFMQLPANEVATLVRTAGPQVCVFPINGTRRWFILEHASKPENNTLQNYMDITTKKYIELYKRCFEHGIDTLLSPVFGSELLARGDEYIQDIGIGGMLRLATHPDFLAFYQEYQVRVHFYGDYRKQLAETKYAYVPDLLDQATKNTMSNNRFRLFYGIFANDATQGIAELSVQHFQKTGNIPTSKELIEKYYGEYVDSVSLFIGFDKFSVFDYPLLNRGEEDLYFTVAPSSYLSDKQLRAILYDHLYSRKVEEIEYAKMSQQDFITMQNFYKENQENTLGVGEMHGGIWYPISQPTN